MSTPRYHTKKIFIQRDYSEGTAVRFSREFPIELRGKIDETAFYDTIDRVNLIFANAEALTCQTYTEGCIACLTGYVIHFCTKTHYERCVEQASRYIQHRNYDVFEPHGVIIGDPMDRGLRCIEINLLYEPEP